MSYKRSQQIALIVWLVWAMFSSSAFHPVSAQAQEKVGEKKFEILVVLVYDQSCKVACTKVRPIMQELARKYGDRLKYVELDGSPNALTDSIKIASELGVKTYLADSVDFAPIVGILTAKGKRIKELQGYKPKEVFEAAIEKALEQKL